MAMKTATGGGMSKAVRWEEAGDDSKTIYVGNVVEGIYRSKKGDVGVHKSNVYEIATKDHGMVGVWGNVKLDSDMEEVPQGHFIRITYLGVTKTKDGKKEFRNFTVEYDDQPAPLKIAGGVEETNQPLPPV